MVWKSMMAPVMILRGVRASSSPLTHAAHTCRGGLDRYASLQQQQQPDKQQQQQQDKQQQQQQQQQK
jgi:hypothetical protein